MHKPKHTVILKIGAHPFKALRQKRYSLGARRFAFSLLLLLIPVLCGSLLCACGGKKEPESMKSADWMIRSDSDEIWTLTDTTYLPEDIDPRYFFFTREALFYLSRQEDGYALHIRKFAEKDFAENSHSAGAFQNDETVTALELPVAENSANVYLWAVCADSSFAAHSSASMDNSSVPSATGSTSPSASTDKFWCLYQIKYTGGAKGYDLACYDGSGNLLNTFPLGSLEGNNPYKINVAADENFCYLLLGEQLLILTKDGKEIFSREVLYNSRILTLSGQSYLAEADAKQTSLHLLTEGTLSENTWNIPLPGSLFYVGEDDMLYLSADNLLYQCSIEYRTVKLLLDWNDADIPFSDIRSLTGITKDFVRVTGFHNHRDTLWTIAPTAEADQRILITLLGNRYEAETNYWIQSFNQSNSAYKIVVVDPGFSSDMEWKDLETKVQLLLTPPDTPDLLDVSYFSDCFEEWASNGAFADLTPFLEAGSSIDKSDYLPNIWACGTVGDKQIFIPHTFSFTMLFGEERLIGSKTGWTLSELLSVCEQYPDTPVFPYGATACLRNLLWLGLDEFVDFSAGTCDFENPLFYETLECAARADSWHYDTELYSNAWTPMNEVLAGNVLLDNCYLNFPEDFQAYRSAIPAGGDKTILLSLKGFPAKNGQPSGLGYMLASRGTFAICNGSKNKEGAWSFIEYVIGQSQEDALFPQIPAKTEEMRHYFSHRSKVTNQTYKQLGLEFGEPTQEEVESIMTIVENLQFENSRSTQILQMISEEVQPYLKGQKSKEEVAEIIQRRVELYLSESK